MSHPQAAETPSRLPAEERRKQLIEVAIDLFSRRGFSGTTTKEIAAAAGVTEAIIFRHFATKQQLYTAIIDYRLQSPETLDSMAGLQDSMERNDDEGFFRLITSKLIEGARRDPKFERVLLYAALEGHELAAMFHQQFAIPVMSVIHNYISLRQAQGAMREMNPGAILFAVAGMAKQYALHQYMCGYKDAGFSDEEAVEAFTRILMDGLRVQPSVPASNPTTPRTTK
jgi:TetR/AcrR family transcriptional regulator